MLKITLKIDGMSCGMCESHVNDFVRQSANVKSVKSSHKRGQTEIIADGEIDVEAVTRKLATGGYRVLSVDSEPYEKKGFLSFLRK